MKKCVSVFIAALLLSSVFANTTNAKLQYKYVVAFQVVNADTFDVITGGSLEAKRPDGLRMPEHDVKNNIRRQLGFPNNSDTRTAGSTNQRLLWISISESSE